VELVHFEVKRRKNYRIPGSKTLTFLYISFFARNCVGSRKTKCESEFRFGTCTFRSKTTQELQNSRFQDANFPLNTFFRSQLCSCVGSRKTKCESEFRLGTCTFRRKTTLELQNSRFQDANFPLNTFFLARNSVGSRKTKCESEFSRGTCTFRSKTTQELQISRFQDANFPLITFFSSQLCRITKN
jgi:uncharacterized protein YgiB involved in biofilm formation